MNVVRNLSRQWHLHPRTKKAYLTGAAVSAAYVYHDMYQRTHKFLTVECKPDSTAESVLISSTSAMFAVVPTVLMTPACLLWPISFPLAYVAIHFERP